jgi:hypothetical protein
MALLMVICCLTACNFTSSMLDAAGGKLQATSKVEDMMTAMAENRLEDAKALMHPTAAGKSVDPIAQMSAFLVGRKVTNMQQTTINVNTSTGTSGKTRQESASFQVKLDDGTTIHLAVTYLSNKAGEGFTSFQLVLGVV